MFISVDLPAPFSPRSACTSPLRRSKSTPSLATTPGKRLVIPLSSRRGASAMGEECKGRDEPAPYGRSLSDRVRDLDLPVHDLLPVLLDGVEDVLRILRAHLPERDAVLGEAERRDSAAGESAVLNRLDRLEDGHVDALHGAGEDVVAEERLVGIHADPPDAFLLRRV